MTTPTMPNAYPPGSLVVDVPAPLDPGLLAEFEAAGIACDRGDVERADHGRDWWPLSIGQVAHGLVPHWPGAVLYPTSTEQVSAALQIANEHRVPVTAQGGRSGVLGGAVAPDGGIALDMTRLNTIVALDEVSATVRVHAGVFGPELESFVNERGWTVGHFPQSFELATVGGWIACRGAGQYSNRYGKIEDIVRALTVVLANGDVLELGGHGPRQAVGPDLMALFVGSEGTLGVITEATLVARRRPKFEKRAAYGFGSFEEGLEACRRVLQRDASPAVLRLYDQTESARNFSVDTSALIVLDEGEQDFVDASMKIVRDECANATSLDDGLVSTWLEHRNDVSALAPLWENGIVVDTLEVAGPWASLVPMYHAVTTALTALDGVLVASVHQSHAYLDGACLYFTFAGRPENDPTAFYRRAWDEATRAVLANGGALSHHHGVGRNRARFVRDALGSAYGVLVAMKHELDPHDILNPGALGIGADPW
ncbi:MAG: FAD-binding oxidoreductase [Acidimicrobiales bacterium]